jgi:hypothetical protein
MPMAHRDSPVTSGHTLSPSVPAHKEILSPRLGRRRAALESLAFDAAEMQSSLVVRRPGVERDFTSEETGPGQ